MGLSVAVFLGRRHMLGAEIDAVRGAATWQITFIAAGELEERDATVTLLPPPDFRHQHILDRRLQSRELLIPMGRTKDLSRREIVLRRATGANRQPFRLTYTFESVLPMRPPTPAMLRRMHELDAAPTGAAYLRPSSGIES